MSGADIAQLRADLAAQQAHIDALVERLTADNSEALDALRDAWAFIRAAAHKERKIEDARRVRAIADRLEALMGDAL